MHRRACWILSGWNAWLVPVDVVANELDTKVRSGIPRSLPGDLLDAVVQSMVGDGAPRATKSLLAGELEPHIITENAG